MLSDIKIRKAKFEGKKYKLYDAEGLYLLVLKKSKRWYFRYRFQNKQYDRSLGKYPFVTLLSARKIAIDAQIELSKGLNPFPENTTHKTFSEAFEILFEVDAKRYGHSTMKNRRNRYEKYVKKVIGECPLVSITPQQILDIVLPLHDSGKEVTAKRVRILIGQVYRDGVRRYGLTYDPTQASQGLKKTKRTQHHSHIDDKRILGRLLADISKEAHKHSPTQFAMTLLPYLFVRPAELRFAKVEDFDLDAQIWRITDGKMNRTHLVPLANQIVELLSEYFSRIGNEGYLFASPYSSSGVISDGTLNKYLKKLGYSSDIITPHGFRGTASTILYENSYKREWIEKQLDHQEDNEVAASYNHAAYLKQRREMMQEYADYLDKLKNEYR